MGTRLELLLSDALDRPLRDSLGQPLEALLGVGLGLLLGSALAWRSLEALVGPKVRLLLERSPRDALGCHWEIHWEDRWKQ